MSMGLSSAVEALRKQPLSPDELTTLQEFQKQFELDDDDPINIVLAMMARSQMIIETAPELLQQKVVETIELHRTNLREQAILSAKELIGDLSQAILAQHKDVAVIWRHRIYWFGAGACSMLVLMGALLFLSQFIHSS